MPKTSVSLAAAVPAASPTATRAAPSPRQVVMSPCLQLAIGGLDDRGSGRPCLACGDSSRRVDVPDADRLLPVERGVEFSATSEQAVAVEPHEGAGMAHRINRAIELLL